MRSLKCLILCANSIDPPHLDNIKDVHALFFLTLYQQEYFYNRNKGKFSSNKSKFYILLRLNKGENVLEIEDLLCDDTHREKEERENLKKQETKTTLGFRGYNIKFFHKAFQFQKLNNKWNFSLLEKCSFLRHNTSLAVRTGILGRFFRNGRIEFEFII